MKKRKRNPQSLPHIIRIDHKSTHGYQVRVPLRPSPKSRFFADGVHGGKRKALFAAKEWRDGEFKKAGLNPASKRSIRYTNSRNQTGVVGVSEQWTTRGGYQYKQYVVSWCPRPHVQKKKTFSAHKHGDDKAFKLAVAFRKQCEQDIMG